MDLDAILSGSKYKDAIPSGSKYQELMQARKIHNFLPDPPLRSLTLDTRNSPTGDDRMHQPLYFPENQLFPHETINSCCCLQVEH